jgi:hypothetical protein
MVTLAGRPRMVGSGPARAVRRGGRARNAKFAHGPSGQAPQGMPWGAGSGTARPMVGVRAGRARLAGAAGHGMRFSRVDAMQRGAGQQRRVGRVRAGRHGWRMRRGAECDFRASMPCNVERASSAGLAGFGPEGHGWRVRRGTECDFRASMPCNVERARSAGLAGFGPDGTAGGCGGAQNAISVRRCHATWSGPAAPGWPGSDRTARLAVAAGHGMRFSRVDAMQRGAGQQRRLGRVRAGRARLAGAGGAQNAIFAGGCGGARNAISARRCHATWSGPAAPGWPGPDRTARLAGAAGRRMRFSCVDAMQRGAGQQRRVGRVRTGRLGCQLWLGAECEFRARTL